MRRRDVIALVAGAVALRPFAPRAQESNRVRRIGVLAGGDEDNPEQRARHAAFREVLEQSGWTVGGNLRVDYRWGAADAERVRRYAAELAALAPDVILTTGGVGAEAMLHATRTVPIVFVLVPDPLGSGLVHSLSKPDGNATGFMMFEYSLCAAGTIETNRAEHHTSRRSPGCSLNLWDRSIRRYPVGGALVAPGGKSDQRARRHRDRAGRRRLCTLPTWRSDLDR